MPLQPKDKAPAFTARDQDGNIHSLKDYKGKKVALYFYPQDDTETCTKQACGLRDNYTLLQEHDIVLLGVSPDNEKSHKKFQNKYSLPFPLLVDTDMKIIKAYDLWQWKKFMGRDYMGVLRTTFLINEKGKIDHIIDRVISKDHAGQILEVWGLAGS